MKRGCAVVLAALALVTAIRGAAAQGAPQCAQFPALNAATQQRANAVQAAMKAKADRKEICKLMTSFVASETVVVKFLVDNKTWCGVPDQVVANIKAAHEKSTKFRDAACTEEAHPRTPTLSDAIRTPSLDTSKNTKAGSGGTFDTLTGNPLAR